jgi:hypothetical protein
MAVAEAGIEEGLQHLNANYNDLASQGWSLIGGVYVRTNTLSDGSMYVINLKYGSQPIILTQSLIRSGGALAQNTSAPFFAAIGARPSSGQFPGLCGCAAFGADCTPKPWRQSTPST